MDKQILAADRTSAENIVHRLVLHNREYPFTLLRQGQAEAYQKPPSLAEEKFLVLCRKILPAFRATTAQRIAPGRSQPLRFFSAHSACPHRMSGLSASRPAGAARSFTARHGM